MKLVVVDCFSSLKYSSILSLVLPRTCKTQVLTQELLVPTCFAPTAATPGMDGRLGLNQGSHECSTVLFARPSDGARSSPVLCLNSLMVRYPPFSLRRITSS